MKRRIAHAIWVTYTVVVSFTLVFFIASHFMPKFLVLREEVARETSPDSFFDAVTIRSDSGSGSSYVYQVYIVPSGEKPRSISQRDEVFYAKNVRGIQVKWSSERVLEIHFDKAEIFNFTNFWYRRLNWYRIDNNSVVNIRLTTHDELLSGTSPITKEESGSGLAMQYRLSNLLQITEGKIAKSQLFPEKAQSTLSSPIFAFQVVNSKTK